MLRIIALQHQLARTFLARAAPELVRALEVLARPDVAVAPPVKRSCEKQSLS